jgi:glycosyltransferase involved in cell wall biosynthesis
MSDRPAMLILSFSPIVGDARVLKQVARFATRFDVVTCGYGPAPDGVSEHIRIPDDQRYDDLDGRLITLRQYRRAYWALGAVRWTRRRLAARAFDIAIANDVEAVPVALRVKPRHGVLADLHEYSPRLHEDNALWRRRIAPWFEWLCRRYVRRAASWSSVSQGIIDEYERRFGFRAQLVANAAPYRDATPSPVSTPIRIVHSGACLRDRQLHLMIEAALAATNDITLDLYLTPNDPPYLQELRDLADGDPRVTVHDPVPYPRLIETLNSYDVGLFVLPPLTFNYQMALPNKLFDFVQARLGVVIGPSVEMVRYVDHYELGIVTGDFTVDATREALDALTTESVAAFKARASAAAEELGADRQIDVWQRMIDDQMGRDR